MTSIKQTITLKKERAKKLFSKFRQSYKDNFHNKKYATWVYSLAILLSVVGVFMLNVKFIAGNKYSYKQLFYALGHWNSIQETASTNGLSLDEWQEIQVGWYNVSATIIAGIGMTLAAVATQSLTRNPMAEGATLGLVQAGIFGVIFSLSFGVTGLAGKFSITIVFAAVGALLLLAFILFTKRSGTMTQKIILAGLAIGIIFKTITFIFKAGDENLKAVSFSYVLGGAEAISAEQIALMHNNIPLTLLTTFIFEVVALVLAVINIKGMNLLEIGDERAKNLGSSVLLTRVINIIVVLLALPAAVILVGNMAFLGLFAVHAARWMMKSRNYKRVLPASVVIGVLMASFGLQLSQHFPQVNSGIWMTFIGAPYLMYIGIRGLK